METKEQRPWWETCWTGSEDLEADGVSYLAYYSEVWKAHHTGKDQTGVRSPQKETRTGHWRAGTIRANLTAGNSN